MRSSAAKLPGRVVRRKGPGSCSEVTSTSRVRAAPDQVEQVAQPHPGPRRRCALQPSTQAIGRSRSAAASPGGRRGELGDRGRRRRPRAGSRPTVAVASTPGRARRLVDRDAPGPSPERTREDRDPAQPRARCCRRWRGRHRRRRPTSSAPARAATSGPAATRSAGRASVSSMSVVEHVADDRQLHRDVHDERADRDPGEGVVGGAEGEGPRVPLRRVGTPVTSWKIAGGDEDADRGALEPGQRELARRRAAAGRSKSFG